MYLFQVWMHIVFFMFVSVWVRLSVFLSYLYKIYNILTFYILISFNYLAHCQYVHVYVSFSLCFSFSFLSPHLSMVWVFFEKSIIFVSISTPTFVPFFNVLCPKNTYVHGNRFHGGLHKEKSLFYTKRSWEMRDREKRRLPLSNFFCFIFPFVCIPRKLCVQLIYTRLTSIRCFFFHGC